MKLSKKLLTVLLPVATVTTVAPIASCGSALVINFADSVNCLNKDKKYKEIADYRKHEEVFNAAKINAPWVEPGAVVSIDDLNNEENMLQKIYFDFICSLSKAKKIFCIQSSWDEKSNKFTTLNIWYQELDEKDKPTGEIIEKTGTNVGKDNFKYDSKDGKVYVSLNEFALLSYSYQEAIIGG